MKCFQHRGVNAVGICRNCMKGLCSDCGVDIGEGIACRGECEAKAKAIIKMINNNLNTHKAYKISRFIMPLFFLIFGLIMLGFAVGKGSTFGADHLMGMLFIGMSLILFIYNTKVIKPISNDDS